MEKVVNADQEILIRKPGIKIMKESSVKKQNQKINDFRTAFIPCDCESELLVVRYDGEFDILDLCIYETQSSFKSKMSWYQKIRYIYQLMKTGQSYTDQIILNRKQINELKGFLSDI